MGLGRGLLIGDFIPPGCVGGHSKQMGVTPVCMFAECFGGGPSLSVTHARAFL